MLKAKKGNRIVRIPDEKKNAYIKLGYEITTMEGKVVHEPSDLKKEVEQLKVQVSELQTRNEKLAAENTDLKVQVSELQAKLEKESQKTVTGEAAGTGKQAASKAQATK